MIVRESATHLVADPTTMYNATPSLDTNPSMYMDQRGGILCEDMVCLVCVCVCVCALLHARYQPSMVGHSTAIATIHLNIAIRELARP
jgi:hypothetical protein